MFVCGLSRPGAVTVRIAYWYSFLDEQFKARTLPLVFDRLEMAGVVVSNTGKLLSGHAVGFSGILDCLSDGRKIKIKIAAFFYGFTTYTLEVLLVYFTEIWLLIERSEISYNKLLQVIKAHIYAIDIACSSGYNVYSIGLEIQYV